MHEGCENGRAARYEKIALDIAFSIANGEWQEGQHLKGRSTLSGKYGVSPETIRRALGLLEECGVVRILDKKGIVIESKSAAEAYISDSKSKESVMTLREDIYSLIEQQRKIEDEVLGSLDALIERTLIMKYAGMIQPLEIKIPKSSPLIGRTIGGVKFWEKTGATIIGIKRAGQMLLSPGPKLVFFEGDAIFFVGNNIEDSKRVEQFVSGAPIA